MTVKIDPKAPKRPTNVSINADLLAAARKRKINLSKTLEAALLESLHKEGAAAWLKVNKAAIENYNRRIERHGLLLERYRTF